MARQFTLKQFRYFVAVAEFGSVASAARAINIAQSALTRGILDLETTLGMPLFQRTARGMTLNQAGYRFQASARKVISSVAEAGMVGEHRLPELTGTLTIGVTTLVAGYYLAALLARFQRSHASVDITVVEDDPPFLEHLLINGEIDLAIMVTNALGDPQALVVELLTSSPSRVWFAAGHPLAAHDAPTLAECSRHPLIVLEADRVETVFNAVWASHRLRPSVTLRTRSLEAVRSLVGGGTGIALLPDFLYRPWTLDADHVEARSPHEAVPNIDVGLVWRRGAETRDAVLEFLEVAREQSRAGGGRRMRAAG